jgi:D-alanyl-D-alanine carboxypeptidase
VITADGTWAGAAGIDGPNGRRAQATDEFGIASVTKMILATLVLRLAEQDKVDLDAPLAKYLDGITVDSNGATMRQALAMRSGLGDTADAAIDKALAHCDRAWTRDEVIATIPAPFAAPGTTYHYSNPTYKLVGYAAEHAAGMPLATALRRNVLDPVSVDRILLQGPGSTTPKPWALPLEGFNGALDVAAYGTGGTLPCLGFSALSLGATAIASDAPSLARWAWGLFSGKIISAESLATMTTTDPAGHGLGIDRITDFAPDLAYGHAGSQSGYSALLTILPERKAVVVVFINDEQADPYATTASLIDGLGG